MIATDTISVALGACYQLGAMPFPAMQQNVAQQSAHGNGMQNAYASLIALGTQNAFHDYQWRQRYHAERFGVPMIWEDMT